VALPLQYIKLQFIPSIIILYLPSLHSWNSLQVSFFHLPTCANNVPTIFTLLHPFLISSLLPQVQPHRQDMFCFLVVCFCKNKMTFLFVYDSYKECFISMCTCIISPISSSPLFFTFLP
jgi:hypothetical protein